MASASCCPAFYSAACWPLLLGLQPANDLIKFVNTPYIQLSGTMILHTLVKTG
jgi:hypothetical protein